MMVLLQEECKFWQIKSYDCNKESPQIIDDGYYTKLLLFGPDENYFLCDWTTII